METLDLDVKDGMGIHRQVLGLVEIPAQPFFIVVFDLLQAVQNLFVLPVCQQLLQTGGVLPDFFPRQAFHQLRQFRIAVLQPAAEGDAVGFIVKLFRINIIEGLQLRALQDLGVESRHSVDGKAVVDIHIGHMDSLVLIDDIDGLVRILCFHPGVQFPDNGHQLGRHLLQIGNRPFFQGLRQNGVVGVGAGLFHHFDGLVHGKVSLLEQTDQLRDHHGRMGVVDLDHHILVQMVQILALVLAFLQDQLRRVADHKILLVDPQQLSLLIAVIGIQEQGQVLADIFLLEIDIVVAHHGFVHGIQIEKMQAVAAVFIARHYDIVEYRPQGKMLKGHPERFRLLLQPAVFGDPGIFYFLLLVVQKFLAEESEMVIQAHPVSRQAQGGDGIQEAGRQTAQSAVAQRRLQFHLLDLRQADLMLFQDLFHFPVNAQIDQVIGQQFSHEEFRGNVVQFLLSLDPGAAVEFFPGQAHQRVKDLALCTLIDPPPELFFQ